jgi:hypothetical protein
MDNGVEMPTSRQVLRELFMDPLVVDRVKLEAFLTVALGIRSCALLTLPADLPDGERMALEAENACRPLYFEASKERDPENRLRLMQVFTQARRNAFARIVLSSPQYIALVKWSERLGVKIVPLERLPTTWEIYVVKGLLATWRLKSLIRLRKKISKNLRFSDPKQFLFAEEFSPEYVRALGRLLEYPLCCVESFVQDRSRQISIEDRASRQIKRLRAYGASPDPYAYPFKDFFPCSPQCTKSKALSEKIFRGLTQALPEAGARYERMLKENCELVEHYPEVIKAHIEKLRSLKSEAQPDEVV